MKNKEKWPFKKAVKKAAEESTKEQVRILKKAGYFKKPKRKKYSLTLKKLTKLHNELKKKVGKKEVGDFWLPKIPRSVSGLKKDGKRDKRFKKGETMQELNKFLEEVAGVTVESEQGKCPKCGGAEKIWYGDVAICWECQTVVIDKRNDRFFY